MSTPTVRERIQNIADSAESSQSDWDIMEILLHRTGFPKARVTYGIVYVEDVGNCRPIDIHTCARIVLESINEVEEKHPEEVSL